MDLVTYGILKNKMKGVTEEVTEAKETAQQAEATAENLNTQFQNAMSALTVDSEVQNIRVGEDGTTYSSAGDAVRGQIADLKSDLTTKADLDELYKAFPTDTASGAIASFSDGADNLPLKSLIVDINPIQDLHGQDAPYPAGGGVNKFKYNASVGTQIINGVTWTLYEDGSIQVSGTASGASTFRYVLPERVEDDDFYFSGNYKFYAFPANISADDFQGGVKIGSKWYSVYADEYSRAFNDADGKIVEAWFQVRVDKTVNATIRPMIYPESESTPTAWSPYENLCPISGWSKVNVGVSGKNLFDSNFADYTKPYDYYIKPIKLEYGKKYVIRAELVGTAVTGVAFGITKKGNRYSEFNPYLVVATSGTVASFEFVADGTFTSPKLIVYVSGQAKFDEVMSNYNITLEVKADQNNYEPYKGEFVTIDLGQTVYGGTLDVVTGELVVDRAMVDMGSLYWSYSSGANPYFSAAVIGMKANPYTSDNLYCSMYPTKPLPIGNFTLGIRYSGGAASVMVKDPGYSDAATFKAAMSGVQLVYELAEPITYHLTPQEMRTLLGQNNIFADTGDVASVEYRADTKMYIDDKIAALQALVLENISNS